MLDHSAVSHIRWIRLPKLILTFNKHQITHPLVQLQTSFLKKYLLEHPQKIVLPTNLPLLVPPQLLKRQHNNSIQNYGRITTITKTNRILVSVKVSLLHLHTSRVNQQHSKNLLRITTLLVPLWLKSVKDQEYLFRQRQLRIIQKSINSKKKSALLFIMIRILHPFSFLLIFQRVTCRTNKQVLLRVLKIAQIRAIIHLTLGKDEKSLILLISPQPVHITHHQWRTPAFKRRTLSLS